MDEIAKVYCRWLRLFIRPQVEEACLHDNLSGIRVLNINCCTASQLLYLWAHLSPIDDGRLTKIIWTFNCRILQIVCTITCQGSELCTPHFCKEFVCWDPLEPCWTWSWLNWPSGPPCTSINQCLSDTNKMGSIDLLVFTLIFFFNLEFLTHDNSLDNWGRITICVVVKHALDLFRRYGK